MFFLASVDRRGHVNCSYKGGEPGLVRVIDDRTLAFPSYDGNGMYLSTGNALDGGEVGLLFIDFERQSRLRVNGVARVVLDDALMAAYPEAQFIVRVHAREIFPNCPRYIHKMQTVEPSAYAPAEGHTPPVPEWKTRPVFREVLPPSDPASAG